MNRVRNLATVVAGLMVVGACAVGGGDGGSDSESVTVYSADGLRGGDPNWFDQQFEAFEKETGVSVKYVEAGSGEVTSRVDKEQGNPQADVLVTLPPFIQQAATGGLLQEYEPEGADQVEESLKDPDGKYVAMVNNYPSFIYNNKELSEPPATWQDLLDPKYKGKLQYSTPGQAGDGTAVLLNAIHVMGGVEQGLDYLGKLEANNVGPSSSTGKLATGVNRGSLLVANGDVQMNRSQSEDMPNLSLFIPADESGKKTTFAAPYYMGLVTDAPQAENGKKLMDFLLTKQAQEQITPVAYGFPARSDVEPTGEVADELEELMSGVTVWEPEWDSIAKDLPQLIAKWQEATAK